MAGFVHGALGLAILVVANTGVVVEIPAASPVSYPESFTLVDVGFAWSRTQWSGGVALFVPFVIAVAIGRSSAWIRVVAGAALVGTFAGQIITAGRSGIHRDSVRGGLHGCFAMGVARVVGVRSWVPER